MIGFKHTNYESHREEQKKCLNVRIEILEKVFAGMNPAQTSHAKYENAFKTICECFHVPTKFLPSTTKLAELHDLREYPKIMKQQLNNISELTAIGVLKKASDSLALRGVFLSENISDQLKPRGVIINPTNCGVLMKPAFPELEITKCLASSEKEKEYFKIINQLGLSMSGSGDFAGPGLVFELSSGDQHVVKVSQQQKKIAKYHSISKSLFVPLASFSFSADQVQLSKEAIYKLREIESLIEKWDNYAVGVQRKTQEFFKKFGSHFNKGPIHLGGVQHWVTHSQKPVSKELVKAVTDNVFNYKSRDPLHSTTRNISNEHCLVLWKDKLVANNANWVVIDRGVHFIPIWDILVNHKNDFNKPFSIATLLEHQWKLMNGYYPVFKTQLIFEQEKVQALTNIAEWLNSSTDISLYQKKLDEIIEIKKRISKASMNPELWPKCYLSLPAVQKFLNEISIEHSANNYRDKINTTLQCIIEPHEVWCSNELNFSKGFFQFVYSTECSTPRVDGACLMALSRYFDFALAHMQDYQQHNPSNVLYTAGRTEVGINISIALSRVIGYFLHHLRVSKLKLEECFIIAIILPLGYDLSKQAFSKVLSTFDVVIVKTMIENESQQFEEIRKSRNIYKIQIFLVSLMTKMHLQIRNCLSSLNRHKQVLKMAFGYVHPDLDEVLGILDPEKEIEEVSRLRKSSCSTDTNIHNVFKLLELSDYFPHMLSMTQALQLRGDTLKCSISSIGDDKPRVNPKLYPFIILQNILSFNYNCKTPLYCDTNIDNPLITSGYLRKKVEEDDDNDVDHNDTVCILHPMDGLLALLHCTDNFLRQDLMCRLATCQIAVPLLLPDPLTKIPKLLLWALRSIVKEWTNLNSGQVLEHQLVSHPIPLVSFMRIGKHTVSKSHLMNIIINERHKVFTTDKCEGGNAKTIFPDGLVEICWYLPSKKHVHFPDIISFANLHGDVREFPRHVKFFTELSWMNFVLINSNDIQPTDLKILKSLSKAPGGLVLLRTNEGQSVYSGPLTPLKYLKLKVSSIKLGTNDSDNIEKVHKKINKNIKFERDNLLPIEEFTNVAHECDFEIDEDDIQFKNSQKIVASFEGMMREFTSATGSHEPKSLQSLCPLQSKELWGQWAIHDKEQYRQTGRTKGDDIENYGAQQRKKKDDIRQKQKEKSTHHHPLMLYFISSLSEQSGDIRKYFLFFIKQILDTTSREKLPSLRRQYQTLREKIKEKSSQSETNKQELQAVNDEIIQASFGLEHMFREFSQTFEAHFDVPQYDCFTQVGAELLIEGHTLELMDGDAAHVPISWIKSVMKKIQKLLNNKRVFVLSVLGIQSSGKSTLLNTVFGLQFTTSAGRCTRGAYMKLLPVHSSLREKCKFEYLLVVDTEGLRAPELQSDSSLSHDNALATFCIGVANLTLTNLGGETPADLDDVLQTAIHAFIRMREVNLKLSCHFVHHHVGGAMAKEKIAIGQSKFNDKLDSRTEAAAKEEGLGHRYKCFQDVINFNSTKDVSLFSVLWEGDPPMAPVNTGYSMDALALKRHLILYETNGPQTRSRNIEDFTEHISKLWEAICKENFIFSFKNTIEIVTYNALEKEYSKWSWDLKQKMIKWEQEAENVLNSCSIDDLDDVYYEWSSNLSLDIGKIYSTVDKKREEYFLNDAQREVLSKWKFEIEQRLIALSDELKDHAEQRCKEVVKVRKEFADVENKKDDYCKEIAAHVRILASKLEKKGQGDDDLREEFERKWHIWITERKKKQKTNKEIPVKLHVQNCLFEHADLKSYRDMLISVLQRLSLDIHTASIYFPVSPDHIDFGKFERAKRYVQSFVWAQDIPKVKELQRISNTICSMMAQYLNDNIMLRAKYHPELATEVLNVLFSYIGKQVKDIPITSAYKVDMAIVVCRYALYVFKMIISIEQDRNDPIQYLERELKKPLFKIFQNEFKEVEKEETAAQALCGLLRKSIEEQVKKALPPKIVTIMKGISSFYQSKSGIKAKVLLEIGEILAQSSNPDFTYCLQYLTNIEASLCHWLKIFCHQICMEGEPTKIARIVVEEINVIHWHIDQAMKEASESVPSKRESEMIGEWLELFHSSLTKKGKLKLDLKELKGLIGYQQLKSLSFFTDKVKEEVSALIITLQEECCPKPDQDMSELGINPDKLLLNELAGCTEQCPFCKEQCDSLYKDHYKPTNSESNQRKHSVIYHRPGCLGGYSWKDTDKMVLEVCTSRVATKDRSFRNKDTNFEWHFYNDYLKFYPEWSIPPDLGADVSLFWKWLVGNYTEQVTEHFGMQPNENLPQEWTKLKWKDIKESLKKDFCV